MQAKEVSAVSPIVSVNTLVEYKGGGYDGCWWELNWAFLSSDGEFQDVWSSGYKAIKSREALEDLLAQPQHECELFALDNETERLRFADVAPIDGLLRVARWFAAQELPYRFEPACSKCGERFDAVDGQGEGVRGLGGIASGYSKILCESCYYDGKCAYCGAYVGPENMALDPHDPNCRAESGYCQWCEEREQEKRKGKR